MCIACVYGIWSMTEIFFDRNKIHLIIVAKPAVIGQVHVGHPGGACTCSCKWAYIGVFSCKFTLIDIGH